MNHERKTTSNLPSVTRSPITSMPWGLGSNTNVTFEKHIENFHHINNTNNTNFQTGSLHKEEDTFYQNVGGEYSHHSDDSWSKITQRPFSTSQKIVKTKGSSQNDQNTKEIFHPQKNHSGVYSKGYSLPSSTSKLRERYSKRDHRPHSSIGLQSKIKPSTNISPGLIYLEQKPEHNNNEEEEKDKYQEQALQKDNNQPPKSWKVKPKINPASHSKTGTHPNLNLPPEDSSVHPKTLLEKYKRNSEYKNDRDTYANLTRPHSSIQSRSHSFSGVQTIPNEFRRKQLDKVKPRKRIYGIRDGRRMSEEARLAELNSSVHERESSFKSGHYKNFIDQNQNHSNVDQNYSTELEYSSNPLKDSYPIEPGTHPTIVMTHSRPNSRTENDSSSKINSSPSPNILSKTTEMDTNNIKEFLSSDSSKNLDHIENSHSKKNVEDPKIKDGDKSFPNSHQSSKHEYWFPDNGKDYTRKTWKQRRPNRSSSAVNLNSLKNKPSKPNLGRQKSMSANQFAKAKREETKNNALKLHRTQKEKELEGMWEICPRLSPWRHRSKNSVRHPRISEIGRRSEMKRSEGIIDYQGKNSNFYSNVQKVFNNEIGDNFGLKKLYEKLTGKKYNTENRNQDAKHSSQHKLLPRVQVSTASLGFTILEDIQPPYYFLDADDMFEMLTSSPPVSDYRQQILNNHHFIRISNLLWNSTLEIQQEKNRHKSSTNKTTTTSTHKIHPMSLYSTDLHKRKTSDPKQKKKKKMIDKKTYFELNRRIYDALVVFHSIITDADVIEEALQDDWDVDCAGTDHVDFGVFTFSLFEVIDNWILSKKSIDFVHFAERLWRIIFGDPSETGPLVNRHLRIRESSQQRQQRWLARRNRSELNLLANVPSSSSSSSLLSPAKETTIPEEDDSDSEWSGDDDDDYI